MDQPGRDPTNPNEVDVVERLPRFNRLIGGCVEPLAQIRWHFPGFAKFDEALNDGPGWASLKQRFSGGWKRESSGECGGESACFDLVSKWFCHVGSSRKWLGPYNETHGRLG